MLLAYLHGGDLPLSFWLVALLLVGLFIVAVVATVIVILTAIHRRAERKKTSVPESSPDAKAPTG